jgi:hypothetical protein
MFPGAWAGPEVEVEVGSVSKIVVIEDLEQIDNSNKAPQNVYKKTGTPRRGARGQSPKPKAILPSAIQRYIYICTWNDA